MLGLWRTASPFARTAALVVAVLHAVISWAIIVPVVWFGSRDAQWGLIWVYFWIADFPVSLIHCGAMVLNGMRGTLFDVIVEEIPLVRLLTPEWNLEIVDVVIPSIVFGVIGPLWYGLLPILFDRLVRPARR